MLWKISVGKARPFFNAQKSVSFFLSAVSTLRVFPFNHFSTLWGPGPLSSGPADGRKQAEFTSAVSAAGVVQALCQYSVSGADGALSCSGFLQGQK